MQPFLSALDLTKAKIPKHNKTGIFALFRNRPKKQLTTHEIFIQDIAAFYRSIGTIRLPWCKTIRC